MERASRALERTRYFEAESVAKEALRKAHAASDFERIARIVLPLQEARRQKRQLAVDSGRRIVVSDLRMLADEIQPGCYLFQPPLIGADARNFREVADSQGSPVLVVCREPLTKDGKWPVVAVGQVSIRTRVEPPIPLARVDRSVTRDAYDGAIPPDASWFEATEEAIGDSAIVKIKHEDPAAWRVDDLVVLLDAHPSHEKLHQLLAEAARQAMHETLPEDMRHRPRADDLFKF